MKETSKQILVQICMLLMDMSEAERNEFLTFVQGMAFLKEMSKREPKAVVSS